MECPLTLWKPYCLHLQLGGGRQVVSEDHNTERPNLAVMSVDLAHLQVELVTVEQSTVSTAKTSQVR